MDLIIWVKVELNYAKTKKCYCKMMQPGGRIFWSIQYFTMKVKRGHICTQQLLMLVVQCSVYVSTRTKLIGAENLPVCVTVQDILKTTQTRETRMDGGCRGCEALCICCTFTWGLVCSEALGLWNAVKHMVMDCCVNTGIPIQLDRRQLQGFGGHEK